MHLGAKYDCDAPIGSVCIHPMQDEGIGENTETEER